MASEIASKLNRLQRILPEGPLVDAAWLEARGYSHPLRQKYVANGWLEMLVRGVYRRPVAGLGHAERAAAVDWRLVVLSLHTLLGHDVAVGGRTALDYSGLGHYLAVGGVKTVHLYASSKLPGWLMRVPTTVTWRVHGADLFDAEALKRPLPAPKVGNAKPDPTFLTGRGAMGLEAGRWTFPISLPERAVLELIDELPGGESFEQVDKVMQGLANARPRLMQHLLEACRSVKVKRLFLFLAERHNHAWLKRLDVSRIDLGAGKRALVAGGRYDAKYRITVPAFLMGETDAL